MRKPQQSAYFIVLLVLIGSAFSACDIINPEEEIPSFLRIDSISLITEAGEGPNDHNIVDAWVFDNEQLIGVYELPAVVPILNSGESSVRVRAGIKLNGQVGTRVPYLYTEDFIGTIELFPDSVVPLNPSVNFHDWVTFKWLEDFEGVGLSLDTTTLSDATPQRISGEEAYEGESLKLSLNADQNIFECRTGLPYSLPGGGTPVMLEFTYKANHPFRVGLFSRDQTGTFQVVVMVLNSTEDWNRIYVNLTDVVSSNPGFIDHRPFFGFIKDENHEGEAYVILDNIRMLH